MTSLLDTVRTLAEPLFGRRRTPVVLRHRNTGTLMGEPHDALMFDDEAVAARFVDVHACEPEAWEAIPA
jgi:hypothetical protein